MLSNESSLFRGSQPLPKTLRWFALGSILLTVLCIAVKKINLHVLHLPDEYCFVVFPWVYRSVDFFCFGPRFQHFHSPEFFGPVSKVGLTFMYPAACAIPYKLAYMITHGRAHRYALLMGSGVAVAAFAFAMGLWKRGLSAIAAFGLVAVCVACSYPLMLNFYLGNIEIVLGFLIGAGLYCVLTDRTWTAATLLGLAAAMKIWPFALAALLLSRKQYRQLVYFVVLALVVNYFSLWLLSGSVAVSSRGIAAGLENFRVAYAIPFSSHDTGVDHSLFGFIKGSIAFLGLPQMSMEVGARVMRIYLAATAVLGLALYFLVIRKLPLLNQMLCICIIAILFPPASHDYTIMHLYVPCGAMALLVMQAERTGRRVPGLNAGMFVLMLCFSLMSEFMRHGNVLSGQIKCLCLIALLVIAMRYPLVLPEDERAAGVAAEA